MYETYRSQSILLKSENRLFLLTPKSKMRKERKTSLSPAPFKKPKKLERPFSSFQYCCINPRSISKNIIMKTYLSNFTNKINFIDFSVSPISQTRDNQTALHKLSSIPRLKPNNSYNILTIPTSFQSNIRNEKVKMNISENEFRSNIKDPQPLSKLLNDNIINYISRRNLKTVDVPRKVIGFIKRKTKEKIY